MIRTRRGFDLLSPAVRTWAGRIARGAAVLVATTVFVPVAAFEPAPPTPAPNAPPRPTYFNLRYDEDFSALRNPPEPNDPQAEDEWLQVSVHGSCRSCTTAMRAENPWAAVKNIGDPEGWRMDLGGEFRLRWESRSNGTFGLDPRTQNAQQNYRWMLHANVKYEQWFRLFAQGIFAHAEDQDGPFEPTQENHGDVQQLFFDLRVLGPEVPLTLRVGRQEFSYGVQRLVGPLDWVSTRRRFDAVKLLYSEQTWNVEAFYAKPVVVKRKSADNWNEQYDFYGLYSTYKGWANPVLDLYFFGVDRTEDTVNPNGRSGDQSVYTLGSRLFGRVGPWDYDAELTGQWGHWAGDTVQAWGWAIDGGYTFEEAPWKPRFGSGVDWTSGDEEPRDGKVGTFNQLFPFDHVCVGFLDFIGRQNLTRTYAGLEVFPVPQLKASAVFHVYWLNADRDALYNAGGVSVLRDPRSRSGAQFGQEIDLWLEYTLSEHASFSFGYSHLWDDGFVHSLVPGDDDADLFIVQYRYRF